MKTNAKLYTAIAAFCATAALFVALGPTNAEAMPKTLSDTELAQINGGGPFSTCGTTTPSCPHAAECLTNGSAGWKFTQNNGYHACSFSVWGSCAMLNSHQCLTRFYDGPGCTNPQDNDIYTEHDSCD